MSKFLCIGGPRDGQWIEADGQRLVRVILPRKPSLEPVTDPVSTCFDEFEYVTSYFREGDKVFTVLVPASEKISVIERLIANYHPGQVFEGRCGMNLSQGEFMVDAGADNRKKMAEILCERGAVDSAKVIIPPAASQR